MKFKTHAAQLNDPDPSTFYGGDDLGYTDYPSLELVSQENENEKIHAGSNAAFGG